MTPADKAKLCNYIREKIHIWDRGTLRYKCRLQYIYMGMDNVFRITDEEIARLKILGEVDESY